MKSKFNHWIQIYLVRIYVNAIIPGLLQAPRQQRQLGGTDGQNCRTEGGITI